MTAIVRRSPAEAASDSQACRETQRNVAARSPHARQNGGVHSAKALRCSWEGAGGNSDDRRYERIVLRAPVPRAPVAVFAAQPRMHTESPETRVVRGVAAPAVSRNSAMVPRYIPECRRYESRDYATQRAPNGRTRCLEAMRYTPAKSGPTPL